MRTTLTLEPDVADLLRKYMAERNVGFKQAVNDAIRSALTQRSGERFRTSTVAMGIPAINLDRALHVAAVLEDDELIRKSRSAK